MAVDIEAARRILQAQPFSMLLGAELTAFSGDAAEIRLPITGKLLQQYGVVHGGVLAYLADNVLTFAGALTLEGPPLTAEMKINYLRPANGDVLIARAKALSGGRRLSVVRCEIFTSESGVERLCAAAQGTIAAGLPAKEMGRRRIERTAIDGAPSATDRSIHGLRRSPSRATTLME